MNCYVNKSFTINKIDDISSMVLYNGNLSKFECNYETLVNILKIIEESSSIDKVYEYYSDIYEKDNIFEFLKTLLEEKIILINNDDEIIEYNVAVIGNENNFKYIEKILPQNIKLNYIGDVYYLESLKIDTKYDCLLLLPSNSIYKDILNLNRYIYKYNIPFIVFRCTGESFVIGPLVLPWQSSCLECLIQQHLNLLSKSSKELVSIDYIFPLKYSVEWGELNQNNIINSILNIFIEEINSFKYSKRNYKLLNKEIVFNKNDLTLTNTKKYTPTSSCSCCHNVNENYNEVTNIDDIIVPEVKNPFDGTQIKYEIGGIRSVSSEETKILLDSTLKKLDLEIDIKIDYTNPFSDIVPVYHSVLKENHKNNTLYLLNEQFSQGKGINKEQAYFSAAFELFERISARYFGDVKIISSQYNNLKKYCADISSMVEIIDNLDTIYDTYKPNMDIDWVWGYSLIDNKPKLIPASLVFFSRNSFKGSFVPIGSSGLSAGATLKDAILQGLFELIEHDAWMIGQANMVRLPILTYDEIKNEKLKYIIKQIKEKGYHIISRDYTNDLSIPVIKTWIVNPKDYKNYAFSGFGASVYPEIALERSITEAIQAKAVFFDKEVSDYGSLYMDNLITERDSLFNLSYFQVKDIKPEGVLKSINDFQIPKIFNSVDMIFDYVKERIKTIIPDADILYVDLTKDNINIPAVKVFITKGTIIQREPIIVASNRLYNFQKNMGYLDKTVAYEDLYLSSYPH